MGWFLIHGLHAALQILLCIYGDLRLSFFCLRSTNFTTFYVYIVAISLYHGLIPEYKLRYAIFTMLPQESKSIYRFLFTYLLLLSIKNALMLKQRIFLDRLTVFRMFFSLKSLAVESPL
jgi:hypothetical protein